jgi:hypothetical protein
MKGSLADCDRGGICTMYESIDRDNCGQWFILPGSRPFLRMFFCDLHGLYGGRWFDKYSDLNKEYARRLDILRCEFVEKSVALVIEDFICQYKRIFADDSWVGDLVSRMPLSFIQEFIITQKGVDVGTHMGIPIFKEWKAENFKEWKEWLKSGTRSLEAAVDEVSYFVNDMRRLGNIIGVVDKKINGDDSGLSTSFGVDWVFEVYAGSMVDPGNLGLRRDLVETRLQEVYYNN